MKKYILTILGLTALALIAHAATPIFSVNSAKFTVGNGISTFVFPIDTNGTLVTGLQAYYKLENVNDFRTATNTLVQSATPVLFNAGKIGNAADSDTTDNNKILTFAGGFGITGGSITLNGWINQTVSSTLQKRVFEQKSVTNSNDYYIDVRTTGVNFVREKYGVATQTISTTTNLTNGTWYMVTLRYNGTTLEGFINNQTVGTIAASGAGAGATCSSWQILGLNDCDDANALKWLGLVDEVGVWNKNLSNQEITDLYNAGAGDQPKIIGSNLILDIK